MRKLNLVLAAFLLFALTVSSVFAEGQTDDKEFPSDTITIVCPFSPGGGTDALSRIMAEIVQEQTGQKVIVVNKTGGSGAVGMGEGSIAKPDGYTVTMTTVESVLLPLAGLAPFQTSDFSQVIRINFDAAALIVRADGPYDNLNDFVDAALANPEQITLRAGTFPDNYWLTGASLSKATGAKFNVIGGGGGGASDQLQALLGGHVDSVIVTPAEAASYVNNGDLKVLAIADTEINPNFPDVPLFSDYGYDIAIGTWRGIMVPNETSEDVVLKLEEIFTAAYQTDKMSDFLSKMGYGAGYLNREDFSSLIAKQNVEFKAVVEQFR